MDVLLWIFLLIAGMWGFQLYLAVKQSRRFAEQIKAIRTPGTMTSVGMGGYRYKGGRAFVALAHKDGVVTGARVLSGMSVFANAKPQDELIGRTLTDLAKGEPIPGLKGKVVNGAKMAAETLLKQKSQM